ncbi:MAG: HEPN domain-containing protein [Sulfolobales archaeon]
MSLRHSKKLLEEAYKDLEIGCYNKAASASYFALRKASEALLKALGEAIPRRDDKLTNAIKNKGLIDVAETLRYIYEIRKVADYGEGVSEEEAPHVLRELEKP